MRGGKRGGNTLPTNGSVEPPSGAHDGRSGYLEGHRRNPLTTSRLGGRVLSASQLLWFAFLPPPGYGVLTTTGRTTGKRRSKCVRAVRHGDTVYVVSLNPRSAWMHNIGANPDVTVRIERRVFAGCARVITEEAERESAKDIYCPALGRFERLEYRMHRRGAPTPDRIRELHEQWFDVGIPVAIDLARDGARGAD